MGATRLQHVSLQVPPADLQRVVDFFRAVFELPQIPNLAGAAWFQLPNGDHVHLLHGDRMGNDGHLALQVDDLQATLERARAHGAEPEEAPRIWGEDRWFFRDPVGNLIEVFERVPPPVPTD